MRSSGLAVLLVVLCILSTASGDESYKEAQKGIGKPVFKGAGIDWFTYWWFSVSLVACPLCCCGCCLTCNSIYLNRRMRRKRRREAKRRKRLAKLEAAGKGKDSEDETSNSHDTEDENDELAANADNETIKAIMDSSNAFTIPHTPRDVFAASGAFKFKEDKVKLLEDNGETSESSDPVNLKVPSLGLNLEKLKEEESSWDMYEAQITSRRSGRSDENSTTTADSSWNDYHDQMTSRKLMSSDDETEEGIPVNTADLKDPSKYLSNADLMLPPVPRVEKKQKRPSVPKFGAAAKMTGKAAVRMVTPGRTKKATVVPSGAMPPPPDAGIISPKRIVMPKVPLDPGAGSNPFVIPASNVTEVQAISPKLLDGMEVENISYPNTPTTPSAHGIDAFLESPTPQKLALPRLMTKAARLD